MSSINNFSDIAYQKLSIKLKFLKLVNKITASFYCSERHLPLKKIVIEHSIKLSNMSIINHDMMAIK